MIPTKDDKRGGTGQGKASSLGMGWHSEPTDESLVVQPRMDGDCTE